MSKKQKRDYRKDPLTPVEIIKNVLGKKFEVKEIDGQITIINKKTLGGITMEADIQYVFGTFNRAT